MNLPKLLRIHLYTQHQERYGYTQLFLKLLGSKTLELDASTSVQASSTELRTLREAGVDGQDGAWTPKAFRHQLVALGIPMARARGCQILEGCEVGSGSKPQGR